MFSECTGLEKSKIFSFFVQKVQRIKENDETLSFTRRGGPWFLEIRAHAVLHGPWTKLEAYMPLTVQTFLGVLQTIPVSNESNARL